MADLHKYTSKEVLNKVLLDSSGDAVNAFSHTTSEALNAILDDSNSRLNVSLKGGTVSGDLTIDGDLTVNGSSGGTYDEILNGNLIVNHDAAEVAGFKRTNGSSDSAQARIAIGNDTDTVYLGLDGDEKFHISFTQNLENASTFVIDDATGNVGIGTAVPKTILNITGASVASATNTGTTPNSIYRIDSSSNVGIGIGTFSGSPYGAWIQVDDITDLSAEYPLSLNSNGGNVGIGTASPDTLLEISKDSADAEVTLSTYHDTDATTSKLTLRKANGSEASPTKVNEPDVLGTISFQGYNDQSSTFEEGSRISSIISAAPSNDSGDMQGSLHFWTAPSGTATVEKRMTIMHSGKVGIGTDAPEKSLHVAQVADDSGIRLSGYDDMAPRDAGIYLDSYGQLHIKNNESSDGNGNTSIYLETLEGGSIVSYPIHRFDSGISSTGAGQELTIGGSYDADVQILKADSTPMMHWDMGTNNIGIGTTVPSYNLDVVGTDATIYIDASATGADSARLILDHEDTGSEYGEIIFKAGGTEKARIWNTITDAGGLNFRTGTSGTDMSIIASGNVGIGIAIPTAKLHVFAEGQNIILDEAEGVIQIGDVSGNQEECVFTVDDSNAKFHFISGKVGIGTENPKTDLTVEGTVTLKEQVAADADTAAYGQIWVKTATPNQLWFTDDAGTDTQLGAGGGGADFSTIGEHVLPSADDTYDLGSSAKRWGNLYVADMQMNNEGTEGNEVDGTTGNWTIQEGEDDLYLLNRKNGKKYKFNLTEVI